MASMSLFTSVSVSLSLSLATLRLRTLHTPRYPCVPPPHTPPTHPLRTPLRTPRRMDTELMKRYVDQQNSLIRLFLVESIFDTKKRLSSQLYYNILLLSGFSILAAFAGAFRTQPLENLSHYLWTNGFLSNPAPGENLLSGNLVMETGCNHHHNNNNNHNSNNNNNASSTNDCTSNNNDSSNNDARLRCTPLHAGARELMNVCVWVCSYIYIYVYVYYIYIYIYIYGCMYVCMYACMWKYVCIYVSMCVFALALLSLSYHYITSIRSSIALLALSLLLLLLLFVITSRREDFDTFIHTYISYTPYMYTHMVCIVCIYCTYHIHHVCIHIYIYIYI